MASHFFDGTEKRWVCLSRKKTGYGDRAGFFFFGSFDDFDMLENKIWYLWIFINLAVYFFQVCENSFLGNKSTKNFLELWRIIGITFFFFLLVKEIIVQLSLGILEGSLEILKSMGALSSLYKIE